MSLTTKQIDELRAYAKGRNGELAKLINDAADTIESLSAKLSAANLERSTRYYNNGWVPYDERPPEAGESVLVTYTVNGDSRKRYVMEATYNDNGEEGWFSSPWDEYRVPGTKTDVIAWMPMPGAYRG